MTSSLLMDYDPMAEWGLAVASISALIALVAAIAAVYAAIYAKAAPTKEDLARVEKHTAESSHHLKQQSHREELAGKAQAVPIVISGENQPTEALNLLLTVHEKHVPLTLTRVGLYNENGSLFGKVECIRTPEAHQYEAKIPSDMFLDWFRGRHSLSPEAGRLRLRVYMNIDDHEAYREVPVQVHHGRILRGNTSLYVNRVEGWV